MSAIAIGDGDEFYLVASLGEQDGGSAATNVTIIRMRADTEYVHGRIVADSVGEVK